jgi:hypothetical protein
MLTEAFCGYQFFQANAEILTQIRPRGLLLHIFSNSLSTYHLIIQCSTIQAIESVVK